MYEIISYNKEKVGIKMTSSKSYVCGLPVCRSNGIKKIEKLIRNYEIPSRTIKKLSTETYNRL